MALSSARPCIVANILRIDDGQRARRETQNMISCWHFLTQGPRSACRGSQRLIIAVLKNHRGQEKVVHFIHFRMTRYPTLRILYGEHYQRIRWSHQLKDHTTLSPLSLFPRSQAQLPSSAPNNVTSPSSNTTSYIFPPDSITSKISKPYVRWILGDTKEDANVEEILRL